MDVERIIKDDTFLSLYTFLGFDAQARILRYYHGCVVGCKM